MNKPIIIGTPINLRTLSHNYRQGEGYTERREYEALDRDSAYSLASDLKKDGFDVQIEQQGPKYVIIGTLAGVVDPVIQREVRWEFRKELLEKSIWTLPKVISEIEQWTSAGKPRSAYKQGIEEAINQGVDLGKEYDNFPVAKKIYMELSRGVENYETDYIVLSKIITINVNTPAFDVFSISTTSAAVVYEHQYFLANIIKDAPSPIKNVLPPKPQTQPPDTIWGWRERANNCQIEYGQSSRYVQTIEWTLSFWSTFLYEIKQGQ